MAAVRAHLTHLNTPEREPLVRLSDLLHGVPPGELIQLLADFPNSLNDVIEAVPLTGETFTVRVTNLRG